MAAARRDFLAATTPRSAVNAATPTSLAATTVASTTPTPAVAIPQAAPLGGLQSLPVIGPMLITPLVAPVNQIPIVGTVLHPLLGYPVQTGLAAGSPVPYDVKVVSFDGTQIYVHFLPATGLAAGATAPTILDGPGLGLPGSTNYLATTDDLFGNAVIGNGALRDAGYNVVHLGPSRRVQLWRQAFLRFCSMFPRCAPCWPPQKSRNWIGSITSWEPKGERNINPPNVFQQYIRVRPTAMTVPTRLGGYGISFREPGEFSYQNAEEFVIVFHDAGAARAAATHVVDQWRRPCRRFSGIHGERTTHSDLHLRRS